MKKSVMFVYMYGRTYVILYFDPRVFVLVMVDPVPNYTKQNPLGLSISTRIILEIELFTVLIFLAGAVKT